MSLRPDALRRIAFAQDPLQCGRFKVSHSRSRLDACATIARMAALLTDLYQLTMLQAYLDEGMDESATFELFVRKLAPGRNFMVAAGLEQALQFLETLSFSEDELDWLRQQGGLSQRLLDRLKSFRFEGEVRAMREGEVCFADEPLMRVTAPLPQAQLVESRLLNIVHFQTLIATKAARMTLAAAGKRLVDFGMRRAHGAEAALFAARASYLAGFSGTATVEAGRQYGIPIFGTMAHSFVQAFRNEVDAFEAFARAHPAAPTLLVDTYDTEAAVEKVVVLAPRLARDGIEVAAVRLDSGDLAHHARAVRRLLDQGQLASVKIFASGNLDEWRIEQLTAGGAPIDGFGVGTSLDTSSDAPTLDAVYKLQSYAGIARRKRSEGKATWPGIKQVCRTYGPDGRLAGDRVQLEDEACAGEVLLQPVMRDGRRLLPAPGLEQARSHCAAQLRLLPDALRSLQPARQRYPVEISEALRALAARVDAEMA
jgi:nicotinate phosphoribosyltransferase